MSNELDPIVGQWYFHEDKGQRFFITAVNDKAETVEVQHFDGDIEEFTLEDWRGLDIELSEEPENWSGALDISEQDDLGTEVTDTTAADWNEPQTNLRDSSRAKATSEPESPKDDYGEGYMEEEQQEQ
jgi:hypothetical protein